MNLDAEIKAAQERVHRSIGQKCRRAIEEIDHLVALALNEIWREKWMKWAEEGDKMWARELLEENFR